jgi:hypothetical protein
MFQHVRRAAEGSLKNVHDGLISPEAHNHFIHSLATSPGGEGFDPAPFLAVLLEVEEKPAPAKKAKKSGGAKKS